VAPAARANKIRALVVSANQRDPALPDVPDAKEAGAPNYQLNVWNAVYAPKGTPDAIVQRLAKALDETLDETETANKLGNLGASVPPKEERGPAVAHKTVAADIPRWAPILKEAMAASNTK
jgi:tripartite-type tricarboxylate transporter receptor subunit TctC